MKNLIGVLYLLIISALVMGQPLTLNDPAMQRLSSANASNGLLNNLVAMLKLSETGTPTSFADATGNGWTGTAHGTVTPCTSVLGSGENVTVDGSSGISVSSSIDTRVSTAPWTVAFWVNTIGVGGGSEAVTGEWGVRSDWVLFNKGGGNNLALRTSDDSGSTTDTPTQAISATGLHFYVVGWDGTHTHLIYDNGTDNQGTPSAGQVRRGGGVWAIMNYQTFTVSAGGCFGQVAYWSSWIGATKITTLYNGGTPLPFSSWTN